MVAAGICKDLASTSSFLGFAPQHLYYLVEDPDKHYLSIEIPKNSNPEESRQISIPTTELKGVQRAIHTKILSAIPASDSVHSYVKGRSILTAANKLCPGRAVLKVDVKDFFPSITFPRVIGLYKSLGFNDKATYILSRLSVFQNKLAQGAPTSPAISNAIFRSVDARMEKLAASWELEYLRYSDDMLLHKEKNFNHPRLAGLVEKVVEGSSFKVNHQKTRYHPKGKPRITLGLLTHGENPRIPGPQRRLYRNLFFKASRNMHWAYGQQERLRGILEWYKCVYGRNEVYITYREILDNVERLQLHDAYRSK